MLKIFEAYAEELNQAVASIDKEPTYEADDVFSWMKTWRTEDEKPLSESALGVQSKNP